MSNNSKKCIANIKPGVKCKRNASITIGCKRLCWQHAKLLMELCKKKLKEVKDTKKKKK